MLFSTPKSSKTPSQDPKNDFLRPFLQIPVYWGEPSPPKGPQEENCGENEGAIVLDM